MNVPDYVKENLYLPYFRRMGSRVRAQQILLGLGIGLLVAGLVCTWLLLSRRKSSTSEA